MIKDRLHNVLDSLAPGCRLVAVSKYHPAEAILACYEEGQRVFGESHEQEIRRKHELLPKDIEWHFIGHLQTNKVKYIAPYIDMVEACDSAKLLREIEKQAAKNNRIIKVLLELHIAEEESKYGFSLEDCRRFLANGEWRSMEHVQICGLMMMVSTLITKNRYALSSLRQQTFLTRSRTIISPMMRISASVHGECPRISRLPCSAVPLWYALERIFSVSDNTKSYADNVV